MAHLLELFVRDHCVGCPEARKAVTRFSAGRLDVTVIERDFDREPDAVARYRLFATPALVIDGRTVLYGVPTFDQLAARCGATDANE